MGAYRAYGLHVVVDLDRAQLVQLRQKVGVTSVLLNSLLPSRAKM